jgi:hypothetical protein
LACARAGVEVMIRPGQVVSSTDVGDLVVRGLSGEHLRDWLPGGDNRAAVARLVSSKHSWSGPGRPWGSVVRDGIGEWADCVHGEHRYKRSTAIQFITWTEVLAVIELGCANGHREAYEAAYETWSTANRQVWENHRAHPGGLIQFADETGIRKTTMALIRHGAGRRVVQDALF